MTKWIRAAHAKAELQAAVAAAYEDAAEIAKGKGESEFFNPVRAIRARGDTDALEAVKAEVRAEALREAAAVCEPHDYDGIGNISCKEQCKSLILALIPADREEKNDDE